MRGGGGCRRGGGLRPRRGRRGGRGGRRGERRRRPASREQPEEEEEKPLPAQEFEAVHVGAQGVFGVEWWGGAFPLTVQPRRRGWLPGRLVASLGGLNPRLSGIIRVHPRVISQRSNRAHLLCQDTLGRLLGKAHCAYTHDEQLHCNCSAQTKEISITPTEKHRRHRISLCFARLCWRYTVSPS